MKFVVKMLRAALLLASVGWLMSAAGWAQSDEQPSLADAARKQKEKKGQTETKEKKTFSNEDLPVSGGISSGGTASSASSSSSASESAAGQAEGSAAAGAERATTQGAADAATAAEEAEAAKKELDSLKHDETALTNGIAKLEQQMSDSTDDSRREIYRNAVDHARTNLADTQKKRAEAEKKLAEKEAAAKAAQQNQPQEQPPQ